MVTHSSDSATDQAISQLNSKVKLIIENIAQLRRQLNDIVSIYNKLRELFYYSTHNVPLFSHIQITSIYFQKQ
jgi:hypothetical protein